MASCEYHYAKNKSHKELVVWYSKQFQYRELKILEKACIGFAYFCIANVLMTKSSTKTSGEFLKIPALLLIFAFVRPLSALAG